MPFLWILITILAIASVGFVLGRRRAMSSAGGDARQLHSLPRYYGLNAALTGLIPAALVLFGWTVLQPGLIQSSVSSMITTAADAGSLNLAMADVQRVANGLDAAIASGALSAAEAAALDANTTDVRDLLAANGVALGSDVTPETLAAAQAFRGGTAFWGTVKTVLVIALSLGGTLFALMKTTAAFRARNVVERVVLAVLIGAASIAILTTVGIVLSLVFNTIEFFRLYPFADFFFGTTWQPSFSGRGGSSELGILPLLWGTLYISFIALLVAVPIGLFAAIYLSEYAGQRCVPSQNPVLKCSPGSRRLCTGFSPCSLSARCCRMFSARAAIWAWIGWAATVRC